MEEEDRIAASESRRWGQCQREREKKKKKVISSIPHFQLQNAYKSSLIGLSEPVARGCCKSLPFPYLILSLSIPTKYPSNNYNKCLCMNTTKVVTHIYSYYTYSKYTQQNHKPDTTTLHHTSPLDFCFLHYYSHSFLLFLSHHPSLSLNKLVCFFLLISNTVGVLLPGLEPQRQHIPL